MFAHHNGVLVAMICFQGLKLKKIYYLLLILFISACDKKGQNEILLEDQLFLEWFQKQFQSLNAWQLSSILDDPRNPELVSCLWQHYKDEMDCKAHKDVIYPFSFRVSKGYLATSGIASLDAFLGSWSKARSHIQKLSTGFGFDEKWRPCQGKMCRFEIVTAFKPQCQNNQSACGRAESIEIYLVVKARRVNASLLGTYEKLYYNWGDHANLPPLQFKVEPLTRLAPFACKDDTAAIIVDWNTQIRCFAPYRGNQNVLCEDKDLIQDFKNPDVFRCVSRQGYLYLQDRIQLLNFKKTHAIQTNLISSWLNSIFTQPVCLSLKMCFGVPFEDKVFLGSRIYMEPKL